MKKHHIISLCTAIAVVLCFFCGNQIWHKNDNRTLKVGFVYIGDAANPYSKNFMRAQETVEELYGNRITCIT